MTSSLKPVPSLCEKLMLDQSLSGVGQVRAIGQAEFSELPVKVICERGALMAVEPNEAVPFIVSEVPPSDHKAPPTIERIKDSTLLLFEGVRQSITDWALDHGLTPAIIIGRLERGMSVADAITTPMQIGFAGQRLPIFSPQQEQPPKRTGKQARAYSCNGKTLTLAAWADHIGIDKRSLEARLRRMSFEAALSLPKGRQARRRQPPGVVSDFGPSEGTGAGSTAQESPEITFSSKG